jgi:hypothetical protein
LLGHFQGESLALNLAFGLVLLDDGASEFGLIGILKKDPEFALRASSSGWSVQLK